MLRKRQEVSGCHADREDHDAEEGMDFAETLPDSALELTIDTVPESAIDTTTESAIDTAPELAINTVPESDIETPPLEMAPEPVAEWFLNLSWNLPVNFQLMYRIILVTKLTSFKKVTNKNCIAIFWKI